MDWNDLNSKGPQPGDHEDKWGWLYFALLVIATAIGMYFWSR